MLELSLEQRRQLVRRHRGVALALQVEQRLSDALQLQRLADVAEEIAANRGLGVGGWLVHRGGQHIVGIRVAVQVSACRVQHPAGGGSQPAG
jgi:hypothetical protein